MFTGLIEELGVIASVHRGETSAKIVVRAPKIAPELSVGDSIAVSGVCLTATEVTSGQFAADVMAETLRHTTLSEANPGDNVNLERALTLGGRLAGHLVTGHVDAVGRISKLRREDISTIMHIEAPREVLMFLAPRGSVAVDGVSLTVVDVFPDHFTVSLIPHTLENTTLGRKQSGDKVNVESDVVAKYVHQLLKYIREEKEEALTFSFLAEHGFL